MTTPPQTPGWYPDPDDPDNRKRYWNGTGWTTHTEALQRPSWLARNRNGLIGAGVVLGGLVLLGAVNDRVKDEQPVAVPQVTMPGQQQGYDPLDYCDPVAPKVLKVLGSTANDGTVRLTNGWYTRSRDYKEVYFVAATLPSGKVAVFSMNGDPSDPRDGVYRGLEFTINDVARNNFVLPYGPDTPATLSMDDDGARDAYDCASVSQ